MGICRAVRGKAENLGDGAEAFPMLRSEAVFLYGPLVSGSAITNMTIKTIIWIEFAKLGHVGVTGDLRDDAGGGNFADEKIGFLQNSDMRFERRVF